MPASKGPVKEAGLPSGVLIIDKPAGPTSHDVVARVRRALGVRRVGHAGTLDPAATGVLVVMVGEATKLAPWLTGADKSYLATVRVGAATDTLDAEGTIVAEAPLPAGWPDARAAVEAALAAERARSEQLPPAFSAIKVAGRAAHRRARAGQEVVLEPRAVRVARLELTALSAEPAELELTLTVSKGYYVRSLARDLGERLGTLAHLVQLRRTASGPFELTEAIALADVGPANVMTVEAAAGRALSVARLHGAAAAGVRHGRAPSAEDFEAPPPAGPGAWLDPAGRLVAVGTVGSEGYALLRVFSDEDNKDS